MSSDALLQRAFDRLSHRPEYMASLIRTWREAFEGAPTDALGVDGHAVLELGTCLRPRQGSWLADVEEVAGACHIEGSRLIAFVRAAEAAQVFRDAPESSSEQGGYLMAARDLDEDEDED